MPMNMWTSSFFHWKRLETHFSLQIHHITDSGCRRQFFPFLCLFQNIVIFPLGTRNFHRQLYYWRQLFWTILPSTWKATSRSKTFASAAGWVWSPQGCWYGHPAWESKWCTKELIWQFEVTWIHLLKESEGFEHWKKYVTDMGSPQKINKKTGGLENT